MKIPMMPRRCRFLPYCPRRARRWIACKTGPVPICNWHFRVMDRLTRKRAEPEITGIAQIKNNLYATIDPHGNRLYLTPLFASQSHEYKIFVLQHEAIHTWLRQEFGLATSVAFDAIYKRPLHCLGHHSIQSFTLNELHRQATNL